MSDSPQGAEHVRMLGPDREKNIMATDGTYYGYEKGTGSECNLKKLSN